MHMNGLTLCMWHQHRPMGITHDRSNIIKIRPCQHRSTQWESCPSLIQHTLMDTVSSMNVNECNIYNRLIPSSSLSSISSSSSSMSIYINIIQSQFYYHHIENIHASAPN